MYKDSVCSAQWTLFLLSMKIRINDVWLHNRCSEICTEQVNSVRGQGCETFKVDPVTFNTISQNMCLSNVFSERTLSSCTVPRKLIFNSEVKHCDTKRAQYFGRSKLVAVAIFDWQSDKWRNVYIFAAMFINDSQVQSLMQEQKYVVYLPKLANCYTSSDLP
jgi:hypothetical protein